MRSRTLATLVVGGLLVACSAPDGAVEPSSAAAPTSEVLSTEDGISDDNPPESTNAMGDLPFPTDILDETASGRYAMDMGRRVTVRLDNRWTWVGPEHTGISVEVVRVNYRVDPGYREWEVLAVAPGSDTLTWDGSPNCDSEEVCPHLSVTFEFVVADS